MYHRLTIFPLRKITGNTCLSVVPCCLIGVFFMMLTPLSVQSQQNDSQTSNNTVETIEVEASRDRPLVLPARASMLSASLPGLGQIYNRKYWKVPIIYAGFGALAYYVGINNNGYQMFRAAYIARVDGNPNTIDDFPFHSTDVLQRAMNIYRRNLEVTYLLGAALYLLNILDANVDAHLMDFDVGETLSMGMEIIASPISAQRRPASHPGLTLRIKF